MLQTVVMALGTFDQITVAIETIPFSRKRNLGTSENKSKDNFPLLTNCSENVRIFYAICDKTVGMCDLIAPKAEKVD